MEDRKIVEMYWARAESAIEETQKKYGRYCHTIAYNVLRSDPDAEECVNDTYAAAWDAMPPSKPERLSAFLGRITRNIALNRYARDNALKRTAGVTLVLDEVEEFLPDSRGGSIADEIALRDAINAFLSSLPAKARMIFVRRYWYLSTVAEIARDFGMSESNVKVVLHRTRGKFKTHLENEGIEI